MYHSQRLYTSSAAQCANACIQAPQHSAQTLAYKLRSRVRKRLHTSSAAQCANACIQAPHHSAQTFVYKPRKGQQVTLMSSKTFGKGLGTHWKRRDNHGKPWKINKIPLEINILLTLEWDSKTCLLRMRPLMQHEHVKIHGG